MGACCSQARHHAGPEQRARRTQGVARSEAALRWQGDRLLPDRPHPGWLLSFSDPQPCQPSMLIQALTRRRSRGGYCLPR